jgi:hypothetical protein
MQKQSKLEAAVIFLDAVVTQVSAAHLQAGAGRHEGVLRELESLLQEVLSGSCSNMQFREPRNSSVSCSMNAYIWGHCRLSVSSALCMCCGPSAALMQRIRCSRKAGMLQATRAVDRQCKRSSG